jgi:Fe-S-cluster-containing dehydrogenase component
MRSQKQILFDEREKTMKTLQIYPERCVGCKLCELACSFKHFEEFDPSASFIRNANFQDEPFFFVSVACFQCEEPYCMEICPAKAMKRNEEMGTVIVDKERCIGCKMCTLACPFGNITFLEREGVAGKCDLCNGDPECAKICPTEAIQYDEAAMDGMPKRKMFSEILKEAYRGKMQFAGLP